LGPIVRIRISYWLQALGEYAFCKVVEAVAEVNKNFRVVAFRTGNY